MNVTPTDGMYKAMAAFVDGTIGEAPLAVEKTSAANKRREARGRAMDWLHNFARLCMREGVRRYLEERGLPTAQDAVKPAQVKVPLQ